MFLRYYTLHKDEKTALDAFIDLINQEKYKIQLQILKSDFKIFIISHDKDRVFEKLNISRVLSKKISNRDYNIIVLFYDFLTNSFRYSLPNHSSTNPDLKETSRKLIREIDNIIEYRREHFAASPNPLTSLLHNIELSTQIQSIRETDMTEYIGYRRSSERGDLIRFYMRFEKVGFEKIFRFYNEYNRGDDEWMVDGFGYFHNNVTYLIGHCKSKKNASTRGLRMMALSNDKDDRFFYGPLISMDKKAPISARIMLIPLRDHVFEGIDTKNSDILSDDKIRQIIDRPNGESYEDIVDEIYESLDIFFNGDVDELFQYICNANLSVIKANPNDHRRMVAIECAFREKFFKTDIPSGDVENEYVKFLIEAYYNKFKEIPKSLCIDAKELGLDFAEKT